MNRIGRWIADLRSQLQMLEKMNRIMEMNQPRKLNLIERIIRRPLFWVMVFVMAAVVANLLSARILGIFYSAMAALIVGFWLADSSFDRVFRWFMRIRHRSGCGPQSFRILRRETIQTHRGDMGFVELVIPIQDMRLQCPKCGRVHQAILPGPAQVERR